MNYSKAILQLWSLSVSFRQVRWLVVLFWSSEGCFNRLVISLYIYRKLMMYGCSTLVSTNFEGGMSIGDPVMLSA